MQFPCMVALILFGCIHSTNGYFVVTAPKIARIGTPYTVSVLLTERRKDVQNGEIRLIETGSNAVKISESFTVQTSENKKDLQIPIMPNEIVAGRYNLEIKMTKDGVDIINSTSIDVLNDSGICMIQTDRGMYKRSQTVKFRVVCIDADLMPVKNGMDITIIDPDSNKVEMYKNELSATGVITKEYLLSDDPKLGVWKISVQQANGQGDGTERNITVDEYVLPRFSVEVKTVPFVYVKDFTSVDVEVVAMYTYGEGVLGSATIDFELKSFSGSKTSRLVDGKAKFTLTTSDIGDPSRLKQELCLGYCYMYDQQSFPMKIHAKVTEDETAEEQSTKSTVNFYTAPVKMKFLNKEEFRSNTYYTTYVHITNPSGGPLPKAERSKYYVDFVTYDLSGEVYRVNQVPLPTDDDDVIMKFTFDYQRTKLLNRAKATIYEQISGQRPEQLQEITDYQIKTYNSFSGAYVKMNLMESNNKNDGVRSATKMYDVGDTIYIDTYSYAGNSTSFKTNMFLYIIAKGTYVGSYEIQHTSTDFTAIVIDSNMDLAPSASLLLLAVDGSNELVADETEIFVSGLIQNQMTMTFSDTRQEVGKDVSLTVNTDPNSHIFLAAIDKSSQLLKAPNDLSEGLVLDGVKEYGIRKEDTNDAMPWFRVKRSVRRPSFYSGTAAKNMLQTVGVVYMTDATVAEVYNYGMLDFARPGDVNLNVNGGQESSKVSVVQPENSESDSNGNEIRKDFPETWIWLDSVAGANGNFQTTFKLPDTITAWTARGFAISPNKGLGIASNIKVEAFKDFFVVVSLPKSAYRGEKIEVKLVVFNYLSEQKAVKVTLKQTQDFVIYSERPVNGTQPIFGDFEKILQVGAGLSKGTNLFILPSKAGYIILDVEATTGPSIVDPSDRVQKVLPVDPEGKTEYRSFQQLIDATLSMQTFAVYPEFPADFVPDSRKLYVAVTGDIMGQSLQNLDRMIRYPCGCGEQNMISLVPNIYALSYMKAAGIVNTDIERKAISYMKQGYQKELNYKHNNGGFSAFGKQDPNFSTWLTAFVMKAFAQASKFIFISDDVMMKAKEALMSQSNRDGSFNEAGVVHHKDMMTGTSSGAMLTAYVYIAIKETQLAGNSIPTSFNAGLTLTYLENFYQTSTDLTPFQLAVLSYCFALGNSNQLQIILGQMNGMSTISESGDMQCWCNMQAKVVDNKRTFYTYDITPSDIETASYVLLAYIQQNDLSKGKPIMKWLMSQINGKGGFMSTQDTVMGLQAVSKYAEMLSGANKNVAVTFASPGHSDVSFQVNKDNSILLQREKLSNIDQIVTDGIHVGVQGTGQVVLSVNWEFNVNVDETFPDLKVTVDTYQVNYQTKEIVTCVWYEGADDPGMGMTYLDIPTGYRISNFDELNEDKNIKKVEMTGRTLNLYFTQITNTKVCTTVMTVSEFIVIDAKPSPVIAQFYYQPEKRTTAYFTMSNTPSRTGGSNCLRFHSFTFVIVAFGLFLIR